MNHARPSSHHATSIRGPAAGGARRGGAAAADELERAVAERSGGRLRLAAPLRRAHERSRPGGCHLLGRDRGAISAAGQRDRLARQDGANARGVARLCRHGLAPPPEPGACRLLRLHRRRDRAHACCTERVAGGGRGADGCRRERERGDAAGYHRAHAGRGQRLASGHSAPGRAGLRRQRARQGWVDGALDRGLAGQRAGAGLPPEVGRRSRRRRLARLDHVARHGRLRPARKRQGARADPQRRPRAPPDLASAAPRIVRFYYPLAPLQTSKTPRG